MALNVDFYNFKKRKNSTLRPSTLAITMPCVIKTASSISNPTLTVNTDNPTSYNYAYISDYKRYYYVTEWTSTFNDIWQARLVCDVLATFRDDIIGTSVYARRTSGHFDPLIDDGRVVPEKDFSYKSAESDVVVLDTKPHYIACVIDANSDDGVSRFVDTSVTNYIDTVLNQEWYEDLFDKVRGFNPLDMLCEVYQTALNPAQCHTLVHGTSDFGTLLPTTEIDGSKIGATSPIRHSTTLLVTFDYSDFRCSSKYISISLYLPCVGTVKIPVALCTDRKGVAVTIHYVGDCITGGLEYRVMVGNTPVGVYCASLKAPVALAKQTSHVAQIVGGAVELTGGAIATATGIGAIGGGAAMGKGIGDIINGAISAPDVTSIGGLSGSLTGLGFVGTIFNKIILSVLTYPSSSLVDASIAGRETHKVVTISNGYYECSNAEVACDGYDREIEDINTFLNGGCYIE